MLSNLYERLKSIHSDAYAWVAPDIRHSIGSGGRKIIRSFVRRWINEWDLRRLYPESEPDIEETEFKLNYVEDKDLEQESRERSVAEEDHVDYSTER